MEIELLNTEVKTAYHTIELLQQRVTDLEQRCCGSDNHQPSVANSMSSNSCLLLGDTNLRPILLSDLHNNCFVRTIHEANMDLIKSWVTHKLDRIPSECILYSGINDLLEEYSPTTILDNLGSLISALKDKNNSMKIYVCQIVPLSMCQDIIAKIEEYNEQLTKWGETNGIKIIETVPTFKLGTGELDELCFDTKNDKYSAMNRLGVIKLLGVIKRQCPEFQLCANWEQVKRKNKYNPQRCEKRNTEANNPTPTSQTAASNAGPLPSPHQRTRLNHAYITKAISTPRTVLSRELLMTPLPLLRLLQPTTVQHLRLRPESPLAPHSSGQQGNEDGEQQICPAPTRMPQP
ncbi:hypothetical protein Pcinc_040839 [Petrolisthes cinctipes]|uniref:SGNH hydrolase-type esterase domain-containing protein n=1 Tax=Petrolisthes cinctipes TaxID=88211 RepID=A0AAE1BL89_PETCI|nr:hypothetical protein Pcinc_040839 [Petrolisthes cinctipes]